MFKKFKRKNIRCARRSESDSGSDEDQNALLSSLEESKELRKIRRKHAGISAEDLLIGKIKENSNTDEDPFKAKIGGMLDLKAAKSAPKLDDAYDTGIGTSFSAETNRRDEDAEMQKFIEENLAKSKGVMKEDEVTDINKKYISLEEAALLSVPHYLRKSSGQKNEEMLSNQMLNGIPEVDLGLDIKIKNIEATEEAKQRLIRESLMKKERPSEFVPKNMAVNFVQHNRFNINNHASQSKKKEKNIPLVEPVVGGGVKISTHAPKRTATDNATDDMHYEKFRKQFRRH